MGRESKIRELRREGKIEPVKKEKRTPKWVKILLIVIIVVVLTFASLGIWGYAERDVAAKVGNETITNTEVQQQVDYYVQLYEQYGMTLDDATKESLKKNIVDSLISESLLVQYAKDNGLKIDEEEFTKNMEEQIKQIIDQGIQENGEEAFNDLVAARFGSLDQYKDYLKEVLKPYVERPLYRQAALDEQYKKINITDDDVKVYWNSVYQVDAEHFLVKVDAQTTSISEKEEAKKLAENIYQEIISQKDKEKDEFDFAAFAKKKAEELNKAEATEGKEVAVYEALGYFSKGSMVKPFEDACFNPKNKIGDIIGVIETDFGYHIIHILGMKNASENYDEPAKVNVRMVLFKYTEGDKESEDAAKMSANSIAVQTKKGLDFVEAVKNFSQDDTTKANNGETGLFTRDERPEIFDAAWSLKAGEIAGPIKTESGYVTIQLIEKKEAVKASLDNNETYEKVKEDVLNEKKQEVEKEFIETLKKQYGIRTTNPWKSMSAFIDRKFGKQIDSFIAWWNRATGKTTETTIETPTETPETEEPLEPVPAPGS